MKRSSWRRRSARPNKLNRCCDDPARGATGYVHIMTHDKSEYDFEVLQFPDIPDIILVWVSDTTDEWIESDEYVTPEP
ncbi:hypothetical protein M1M38_gp098 [Halorubrum tailed virus 27]|uniref:Uncharacterized protein n=1 Tax=Halorubrum tailed virus 27 TaxID=2878008 RepID=A0AAE8XZZ3_9CAUD|nr:hypothetical protein M1M38_gp098 [Halorubrum tailed virus 27]UBF22791.1 hypothetical protein HRTV-27_gp98 [Halorubrum tailed virus 27]